MSVQNPAFPRAGRKLVTSILSPFERVHHGVVDSGESFWRRYVYLLNVESERDSSLQRVKALEAQNSRLTELESENQRLRGLLSFVERTDLKGVSATVIGRDASNWVRSVTIDRGSADGLKPGFPVVDGEAVVGQTTVVTPHSAKILLINDSLSAIGALVQSSRAPGIVEGGFDQKLQLRYVQKEYPVKIGDRVVASGLDGVFPKGVLLGIVTEVHSDAAGMFQNITINPTVDVHRIENVLVLIPGWNQNFKEQYEKPSEKQ